MCSYWCEARLVAGSHLLTFLLLLLFSFITVSYDISILYQDSLGFSYLAFIFTDMRLGFLFLVC